MAFNAAGIVMGGRRTKGRIKSKRTQPRKAQVKAKVKLKVTGTPEQVHTAMKKVLGNAAPKSSAQDKVDSEGS